MNPKPSVIEVFGQDEKIAALKQFIKAFTFELPARFHQDSRIFVASDQNGQASLGILVFTEHKDSSRVIIEWIYVKKLWRKLLIGRSLMDRLERDCIREGISMIEVMFDQHNSGMHRLASRSHGWSTSGFLDAYSFSAKEALAPAVIKMEAVMQRRNLQASILPLSQCNDKELLQAAQVKNLPKWAEIDQFQISKADRKLSRVFYLKGHIIGWLMVHVLTADTLDYRCLWLDQEHRHTGIMVKALNEVMRAAHLQEGAKVLPRSDGSCCPWNKGFFLVSTENRQMISWVNKRLTRGMYQKNPLINKEKILATAVCD